MAEVCRECQTQEQSPEPGRIIFDINDNLSADNEKELRKRFLKAINALLNDSGTGTVIIHVTDPYYLNMFDSKVDEKLNALISDDSFYHDNFERYSIDANHVVYRVKPRQRPLSTYSFNTYVSLNKGKADPTHAQMKLLVRMSSRREPPPETPDTHFQINYLGYQKEVLVSPGVFQEQVGKEAKSVPQNYWDNDKENNSSEILVNECLWLWIPIYVSAFTKLSHGGSLYLGISEEKKTQPKWQPAQNVDQSVITFFPGINRNFNIYIDGSNHYHVVPPDGVPKKERKTGRFLCNGLRLTENDKAEIRDKILDKLGSHMLWLGHFPTRAVDVKFHEVSDTPIGRGKFYVIEVVIEKFAGVAFCNREGPEAYKLSEQSQSSWEPIDIARWVCLNEGTISKQTISFR